VTDFKKLKVWQKAHVLAMDVHRAAGRSEAQSTHRCEAR
jgi:hypothetical protein